MANNLKPIKFGKTWAGQSEPCFILAEAGVNHNGDLTLARQLVKVAAETGANAIKFQTFSADRLVTHTALKAEYQSHTTDASESQYDMLKRLELSTDAHRDLMAYCAALDILFLSTPFDEESADLLESLGVSAFKIPSGEIVNLPYLIHVARKGKPMIVSTGMSYLSDVETAVRTIRSTGNEQIVLLHCVSNYPATPGDINLRAMHTLSEAFGVPVGLSDHTLGGEIAVAAVALGACLIEKHFTLDRNLPGPDHQASLLPGELSSMISNIRNVEAALGDGIKQPVASELNTIATARKSLVTKRAISAGAALTELDIAIKRPGTGLPPTMLPHVLGRRARVDIEVDSLINWEMLG